VKQRWRSSPGRFSTTWCEFVPIVAGVHMTVTLTSLRWIRWPFPKEIAPDSTAKARVHPFADPGDSLQRRHRQHLARPQPIEELPKGKDPDFPKSQTPVSQVDADGAGDHLLLQRAPHGGGVLSSPA
jgi:hypothetical protein